MWTSNSAKSVFHIFCVDVVTGLKFGCSSVWRGSIRYGKRDDILLSPLSDYLFHFCTKLKYSCFTMPCTALISPSLKEHTLGPQMKVSSASSNIVKTIEFAFFELLLCKYRTDHQLFFLLTHETNDVHHIEKKHLWSPKCFPV